MEKLIIENYNKGMSAGEILKLTNYKSQTSIFNILKKHGIKRRTKAGVGDEFLNHDFFEKIDSEVKAYLLGYFYADGNVFPRKNAQTNIRIELNKKDIKILELFKHNWNTKNAINKTRKECYKISIHSNKMQKDLEKWNIIPNKSYSKNGLIIPKGFENHFLRGVMDGDGWVYLRNKRPTIGFCGTKESMTIINDFLKEKLKIEAGKVYCYENKVPFILFTSKEDVKKVKEFLYKDATYFLERKKKVFDANTEVAGTTVTVTHTY